MEMWKVDTVDAFDEWWDELIEDVQIEISAVVKLLRQMGPSLGFPYSSGINESKFSQMRELRIQHKCKPYRILYAFDPTRTAILLIGGDKTGKDRWYKKHIPLADKLFEKHLKELKEAK
jgi:hypothetical protein